jgi:hypothetical protein
MKIKLSWPLVFFVAAVCCLLCWNTLAQKSAQQPQQPQQQPRVVWEYKIVNETEKPSFNELGAQGWELAAVADGGAEEVYFFKRAK